MPQLAEIVSLDDMAKLYPNMEKALTKVAAWRKRHPDYMGASLKTSILSPPTKSNWAEAEEYAEVMLHFVHSYMFAHSRPQSGLRNGFTHRWSNGEFMVDILSRSMRRMGLQDLADRGAISYLANRLTGILRANGLAEREKGGTNKSWLLRPWPYDGRVGVTLGKGKERMSTALEAETRKREREEGDKPVIVNYTLSTVPIPDPFTPDAAITYILKVKEVFDRLSRAYGVAQRTILELEDELKEAKEVIEASEIAGVATGEWAAAGELLREEMKTNGTK